jgi:hypothetical protein
VTNACSACGCPFSLSLVRAAAAAAAVCFTSAMLTADDDATRCDAVCVVCCCEKGAKDAMVPPEHSLQLHKLATASRSAELYVVQEGNHNDCWQVGGVPYFARMDAFVRSVVEGSQ